MRVRCRPPGARRRPPIHTDGTPISRGCPVTVVGRHFEVRGTVQGVGFRPRVYRLATEGGRDRPRGQRRVLGPRAAQLSGCRCRGSQFRPVGLGHSPLNRTPGPCQSNGNGRKIMVFQGHRPARALLNRSGRSNRNGVQQAGVCGIVGRVSCRGSRWVLPGGAAKSILRLRSARDQRASARRRKRGGPRGAKHGH